MADTNQYKKVSGLIKGEDGTVYQIAGGGSDNAVTLDTEQTITAAKTFDVLPKSDATPSADNDLITKAYLDERCPIPESSVTLKGTFDTAIKVGEWMAYSELRFTLLNGKHLVPLYLDNTNAQLAKAPVKVVYTISDTPYVKESVQLKEPAFFDTYELQPNEITGLVTYPQHLDQNVSSHSSYVKPFDNMYIGCSRYDAVLRKMMKFTFFNLDVPIDIVSIIGGPSYTPLKFQLEASHNNETFVSKEYTQDKVEYGSGVKTEVHIESTLSNFVTLNTEQTITAKKTFSAVPQVTGQPEHPNDVATVAFVKNVNKPKPPYNLTIDLHAAGSTASTWASVTGLEIMLDGDKKLKCLHLDDTSPTKVSSKIKAVFKVIPASETITGTPAKQTAAFFETYQLQADEYFADITYGKLLNPKWTEYGSYRAPFGTLRYGCYGLTELAPMFRVELTNFPLLVEKLVMKNIGSSELPKQLQATISGTVKAESNVLDVTLSTPLELVFDPSSFSNFVTTDTNQSITGLKTFVALPKSNAAPSAPDDLVTKAYVDAALPGEKAEVIINLKCSANGSHVAMHDVKFSLTNGKFLVPVYLEDTDATKTDAPVKAVFAIADAASVELTRKPKAFFEDYDLASGQFAGSITYAHVLSSNFTDHGSVDYQHPFKNYIITDVGADKVINLAPVLKYSIEKLNVDLAKVSITNGSAVHNGDYAAVELSLEATFGDKLFKSKVYTAADDGLARNSVHEIPFDWVDNYVTTNTPQSITAQKTFTVLPQSSTVPTNDADLVNKKYVDDKVAGGGGGQTADNVVTLDTEQSITAVKTFEKLPKSNVLATEHNEFATKAYVDGFFIQPQDYRLSVFLTPLPNKLNNCGFSYIHFRLSNGKALIPKYVTNNNVQTYNNNSVIYEMVEVDNVPHPLNPKVVDNSRFQNISKNLLETQVLGVVYYGWGLDTNCKKNAAQYDPFAFALTPVTLEQRTNVMDFTFTKLPCSIVSMNGYLGNGAATNAWAKTYEAVITCNGESLSSGVLDPVASGLEGGAKLNLLFDKPLTGMLFTYGEQSVTGVKKFEVLPQSTVEPNEPTEFVTKSYVDKIVEPNLTGYEVTLYGKIGKKKTELNFGSLRLFLANGQRIYPRFYDNTTAAKDTRGPARYVWSFENYRAQYGDDPLPEYKTESAGTRFKLSDVDLDGTITFPHLLGTFKVNTQFQPVAPSGFLVTGDPNVEQPLVRFTITGAIPPITDVQVTSSHLEANIPATMRAEVRAIGSVNSQTSTAVKFTAISEQKSLVIKDAFAPNPYYMDVYTKQYVRGAKTFETVPIIEKEPETFGAGPGNTPALFGDLGGKLGVAVPAEYDIQLKTGCVENKKNTGGSVWEYSYTTTIRFSSMKLSVRDPKTLEIKELFLKGTLPNGKGVLSYVKPENYPEASCFQSLPADYALLEGEYFARLTSVVNGSITKLFMESDGKDWYTTTTSLDRFPDSSRAARVNVYLTLENCPVVTSWSVSNSCTKSIVHYNDAVIVYGSTRTSKGSKGGQTFTNVNWASVNPDVNVQALDVVTLISNLQDRVKALEAAANPTP